VSEKPKNKPMTLAEAIEAWNRVAVPALLSPVKPLVDWLACWIEHWPRWARRLLDLVP